MSRNLRLVVAIPALGNPTPVVPFTQAESSNGSEDPVQVAPRAEPPFATVGTNAFTAAALAMSEVVVVVEGDDTMMALDTSGREIAPVAGLPAAVPVIDAGKPQEGPGTGLPLPPAALARPPLRRKAWNRPPARARRGRCG